MSIAFVHIDTFLKDVAKTLKYPRKELSFVAELRNGGPTIQPGVAEKNQIEQVMTAKMGVHLPSAGYDSLGSRHIEYRVVHTAGKGKVKIPRTLYTWQHHVLPGNCRACVNRWVQVLDDKKKWPKTLQKRALQFRAKLARSAGYRILQVTTGKSFKGEELLSEFQTIFKGNARVSLTICILDLTSYVTS